MKRKLGFVMMFLMCTGILTILPHSVWANVHGQSCANCHTMHNMQNGQEVVAGGPLRHLLADSCIGCHTGDNTEIASGGTTPYVYNTSVTYGPGGDTLAGGNFYWVATAGEGNDTKGHNVLGLSAQDLNIPAGTAAGQGAPGGWVSCANSCHSTLAAAQTAVPELGSGCEGCHIAVGHHKTGSTTPTIADEEDGWFRFCAGHMSGTGNGVEGIEDIDWQYTNGSADHNEYLGFVGTHTGSAAFYNLGNTMTAYCCGCHGDFHIQNDGLWIRHPSDAYLPGGTTEYAAYTTYSTEAPVARPSLAGGVSATVTPNGATDMVMCLSCHRAHGSPYDDMLRWDYDEQIAGGGGAPQDTGCFTCHTTKDD